MVPKTKTPAVCRPLVWFLWCRTWKTESPLDRSEASISKYLDLRNSNTGLSSDFWGLGSNLNNFNPSYSGLLQKKSGNFVLLEALSFSNNFFEGRIPSGLLNCQALVLALPFANLSSLNLARSEIHERVSDCLISQAWNGPLIWIFQGIRN